MITVIICHRMCSNNHFGKVIHDEGSDVLEK